MKFGSINKLCGKRLSYKQIKLSSKYKSVPLDIKSKRLVVHKDGKIGWVNWDGSKVDQ